MKELVRCNNISKVYKNRKTKKLAVNNLSFSIYENEILGFIGINGSGKSTTIKMLTGILLPTSGKIDVLGYDPYYQHKKILKNIGVVFGQRSQLIWDLPAVDTFKLHGKIYELSNDKFNENISKIFSLLDIRSIIEIPVRKMSLGQRMCCEIAASLIHMPQMLFLDEPTIGLDLFNKESMRKLVLKLKEELGISVLLTSHDLEDIEQLSDRIIIIDNGIKLYEGTRRELNEICGNMGKIVIYGAVPKKEIRVYPDWFIKTSILRDTIEIYYEKNHLDIYKAIQWLYEEFSGIRDFNISNISLEETLKYIYNKRN